MNKTKRFLIAALALTAVSFSASASVIPADAFTVDKLIGSVQTKSGDKFELAALKGLVPSYTGDITKGDTSFTAYETAAGSGTWYIDLADDLTPGYFALKFGIGNTNATANTFFFQNLPSLNYLVFTNAQVQNLTGGVCADPTPPNKKGNGGKDGSESCNIGRLSHYSLGDNVSPLPPEGGPDTPPTTGDVPEPASLALLGVGMLGLTAMRKRRA